MRTLIIILVAAFALVSCRSQDLIRPGDTLDVAFEKAKSQYDQENWSTAARAFETVVSIGRGTDVGQEAQFLLAESYYNNRQYLIAASEYQRYTSFYPRSERREQADFKQALSYYQMSPRYKLDQTYTRQAIDRFRLFNSRYPDSELVAEASGYIEEMREKLARKQYEAANFYMRTNRYQAAIVYHDIVIDSYPETVWAERSLVDQIEAYIIYADNSVQARQKERYEEAVASYETYLQLFPRGENRSRAESLYDRATREIERIAGRQSSPSSSDESVAQNE
ncbi:outer membrane protein assembly factor BamD [Rhodohalobacter sp. SW132]|uniref:outer membrane protein assembly factor BamD n=1 Tax=Rhodohalobacter sp. SW132 TaxID=2293433 RepID=UPI000E275409|nr:outer membrane protein assembly factor BamD [Rhodohalobacter sp. SW132]REL33712.1 outer membrane protein assembly factor BamD [Rhodohalobacter sp. SW132]